MAKPVNPLDPIEVGVAAGADAAERKRENERESKGENTNRSLADFNAEAKRRESLGRLLIRNALPFRDPSRDDPSSRRPTYRPGSAPPPSLGIVPGGDRVQIEQDREDRSQAGRRESHTSGIELTPGQLAAVTGGMLRRRRPARGAHQPDPGFPSLTLEQPPLIALRPPGSASQTPSNSAPEMGSVRRTPGAAPGPPARLTVPEAPAAGAAPVRGGDLKIAEDEASRQLHDSEIEMEPLEGEDLDPLVVNSPFSAYGNPYQAPIGRQRADQGPHDPPVPIPVPGPRDPLPQPIPRDPPLPPPSDNPSDPSQPSLPLQPPEAPDAPEPSAKRARTEVVVVTPRNDTLLTAIAFTVAGATLATLLLA